jgi:hypothetical protein
MTQTCRCGHKESCHFPRRNTPGQCEFCDCREFVDVTDTLTAGEQAQILAYIRRQPGEPADMNSLPAWLLELERTRLQHNLTAEENRRLNVQVTELVTTINGMVEGRNAERAGLKNEIADLTAQHEREIQRYNEQAEKIKSQSETIEYFKQSIEEDALVSSSHQNTIKSQAAQIAEFEKALSGAGFEIYHDPDGRIGLKNHECIYVPLPEVKNG